MTSPLLKRSHKLHTTDPGCIGKMRMDHDWEHYRLRDGGRLVTFDGLLLASVTSERPDVSRWTEIEIYETRSGMLVVHRVGVSAIVHLQNCPQIGEKQLPGIADLKPDEFAIDSRDPCAVCRPDIQYLLTEDPASLRFERDRHWVGISDTAPSMIESLHSSRNGARALSSLATSAIETAAQANAEVHAAYYSAVTVL